MAVATSWPGRDRRPLPSAMLPANSVRPGEAEKLPTLLVDGDEQGEW